MSIFSPTSSLSIGAHKRAVEVGWLLQTDRGSFVWDSPRVYHRSINRTKDIKSVGHCPAVNDFEAKIVEVLCPFDLHLGISSKSDSTIDIVNRRGEGSGIVSSVLSKLLILSPQSQWRDPKRPVFQIRTPYTFLSDDVVYLNQLPPFMEYRTAKWPGLLVGGRFPIHVWPRTLNWAFEWCETDRDLILERGQPWFYCRFETPHPQQNIQLVEAAMTPPVQRYLSGIESVAGYTAKTFSLFSIAQKRRPRKLVFHVDRDK